MLEAVYYGVPIVGVPLFWDQYSIAAQAVSRGFGVKLDRRNLTPDSIYKAIMEVLQNPLYKENILAASNLMRNQLPNPIQRAVNLVEIIAKTKGAKHLRVPIDSLNFLQLYCLDVYAFLLVAIASFFALTTIAFTVLYRNVKRILNVKAVHLKSN